MNMNIRKALLEAIDQSDLSVRDKFKLRTLARFPGALARHEEDIVRLLREDGVSATDWLAVLKYFVEVILPILLKLFDS